MRKTKNLYDFIAETETEEDLKFAFAKFMKLKPSSKNFIDLYTERILFEFKFNANLKNHHELAKCVAQALYYVRKLKFGTDNRPVSQNICVVCKKFGVLFPTETFAAFYENDSYDWDLQASSPCKKLVADLETSEIITRAHVYDLTDREGDCLLFVNLIERTGKKNYDSTVKKQINQNNFYQVFKYWESLFGEAVENGRKASEYFITDIERGKTKFIDYSTVKFFMTSGDLVEKFLNPDEYRHFWSVYDKISDAREIIAIRQKMDRLTEIQLRRYTGEFFTPLKFADKAIEYLKRTVGEWWKTENFRLWDMAAGTGNLEYDLPADALKFCYISTLLEDDADYCRKIFRDATVFQYDYLNDDEQKLPKNLREDLANPNLRWIIFINPPYATASNFERDKNRQNKDNVSMTAIREQMNAENLGEVSRELTTQFLYRISHDFKNSQAWLGMFSKIKYINSNNDQNFRDKIFSYVFERGFIFNSKSFDGCKGEFPVGFLIWNLGKKISLDVQNISLDVFDSNVEKYAEKIFKPVRRADFLNKWIDRPPCTKKFPPFSGALNLADKNKDRRDRIAENFLASFMLSGNDFSNQNYTAFLSGAVTIHGNVSVTPENFEQCMIVHMVRRLPKADWLNDRDQFMQPTKKLTPEFVSDAVIWSLFSPSNQTVSLRDVAYEGEIYRIRNNFFPFTLAELKTWACSSMEMVRQIDSAREDRFAALWIKNHRAELSIEALEVLNAGRTLYKKFFAEISGLDLHKWKISDWDAGFYQIRMALDAKVDLSALSKKLEPQIYELGFLRDELRYF
ncbi:MAG: hypothetical protein IJ685_09775 [Selenomonadaceae bacterium]|nr:hypothetical protein [Selenomonadaceae bacterium]